MPRIAKGSAGEAMKTSQPGGTSGCEVARFDVAEAALGVAEPLVGENEGGGGEAVTAVAAPKLDTAEGCFGSHRRRRTRLPRRSPRPCARRRGLCR